MRRRVQWLTTGVNPRARERGADGQQRGWRRHAVMADDRETFASLRARRAPALCGLVPAHGWGLDLFADGMRRCARCDRARTRMLRQAILR